MNVLQSVITLFIEPDDGPTMPVKLDMLEIETDVVNMPISLDRNVERVNAIVARIKAAFPKVQPEIRKQDLRSLITRLTDIINFDGVVLHLPGIIDGPLPLSKNPGQEQFEKLSAEGLKMKAELQVLTNKFKDQQNENTNLKTSNVQLESNEKAALDKLQPLQKSLKERGDEVFKAQVEIQKYKTQLESVQKQLAGLKVQYEKAMLDLQTAMRDQQELVRLRQVVATFRKTEQDLNDAIKKRDQDIARFQLDVAELQRVVQRLQNQAVAPRPQGRDEPRDLKKNPYLDNN